MPIPPIFMQPKAAQPKKDEGRGNLCDNKPKQEGVTCIDFFSGSSPQQARGKASVGHQDGVAVIDFFGSGTTSRPSKRGSRAPQPKQRPSDSKQGVAVVDFFGGSPASGTASKPKTKPSPKTTKAPPAKTKTVEKTVPPKKEKTPGPRKIEPKRTLETTDARTMAINGDPHVKLAMQRAISKYNVTGKIVLKMNISPTGKITSAEVVENTTGSDAFEKRFVNIFRGRTISRYSSSQADELTITYKFRAQ